MSLDQEIAVRQDGSRRFYELDSLRGVAALTVVLHHFLQTRPMRFQEFILFSPLRILFAGHEAVVLFFVLSGFVLTLPYIKRREPDYGRFLLKRICRIYLPYLAALALAVGLDALVPPFATNESWINRTWSQPVSEWLVLQHVLFLGSYNWTQYNTAFWSLVYEMRISLVFPFMALWVLRARGWWPLAAAAILSLGSIPLTPLLRSRGLLSPEGAYNTAITLHYAAFFLVGALLAHHLTQVNAWYRRLEPWRRTVLIVGAVVCYGYASMAVATHLVPEKTFDWLTAAGSVGFIVLAMNFGPVHRFLTSRVIHHLGAISYSLYLVHGTVLFTLIHLYMGRIPWEALFVIYLVCAFAVTELFHFAIEVPTMNLARRITAR